MGIYDRDYYRSDSRGSFGYASSICKILVGITIAVFILQLTAESGRGNQVTDWLAVKRPFADNGWQLWRFVTAAFCHSTGNILHILFNMLFLWWFGKEIEEMYGGKEFLALYLGAAAFSSICFVLMPFGGGSSMIGASGAVSAVVMLYALYYPRRRVYFYGIIPIEIRWLLVIYIVYDLLPLLRSPNPFDNVAHVAHLGGFAYGAMFKFLDLRLKRIMPAQVRAPRKPKLRVFHPEAPPPEPDLNNRVDEILLKISRTGVESLTREEQELLDRASEQIRRKRGS